MVSDLNRSKEKADREGWVSDDEIQGIMEE